MTMGNKPFAIVLLSVALLLGVDLSIAAQGTTSRFTGTVTDSSGAAVAGATVTLTNEGTNTSLITQTRESGAYVFDLIQIGSYEISVEKEGFKKFVSRRNVVNVNQPATVNIALEVGAVSETVTVQNSVEEVQTSTSGNIGSTVEQKTLENLPIVGSRGRNPLSLLNFQPGVVSGNNTAGGGVHVHGSRDRSFNFTLDGIDINESSAGGSNFTPLRPNPDSIQEFQVVTSNFTAELGRSSGAQVTFVTRSGTNQFNGSVFEFYRTPELNANEYENNLNGRLKPQFVQHIFGGSVGGPIIKDKLFFFTNLQLLRQNDSALITRTVYTQQARSGIFRYVRGGVNSPAGSTNPTVDAAGNALLPACGGTVTTNCIATYNINANTSTGAGTGNPTATGLDPALLNIINSSPLPNTFAAGDGLNTAGFSFNAPGIEKQYDFVAKIDYSIADNQSLYVRYAQGEQNTFGDGGANSGRPVFPGTPAIVDTFRSPKNLAVNYRLSPTSTLTNEVVVGWSKFAFSFDTSQPDPSIPFLFNNPATPNINFSYNARSVRTWQFVDNLTWVKGNHTIKGGINFRFGTAFDDRSNVAGTQIEPNVRFNPPTASLAPFVLPTTAANGINSDDLGRLRSTLNDLLGRIGTYNQAFVSDESNPSQFAPAGTRWLFSADYPEYDFYAQDTWKILPNLTVDLGLRWEFKLAPKSNGRPILAPDQPFGLDAPATNSLRFVEKKVFENDLNNISPSIGVAWDPLKDGKTSIRANYRLSYDRFATFLFSSSIFQSAPGNTFLGQDPAFSAQGNLIRNGLPSLAPTQTPDQLRTPPAFGTGSITVVDPDLVFPEIHQFALSFQREFIKNTVFEFNYIYKRGEHLIGGYNANQVNILATDQRCGSQTFLAAFIQAQDAARANDPNCLASLLVGGPANGNSVAFRGSNQFATQLAQNNVASAAATLSARTGSTSLTTNGFSPFLFQRFTQYLGGLNVIDSRDLSRYNGLEFIVKRRFNQGVSFQAGYTFSRSKDTRSFDPVFTVVGTGGSQSAGSTPYDINNRELNYAPSDFDKRHSFQATYVYELPLGRGRTLGRDMPKLLDYVIGGWQLAGNVLWTSGTPFTVYSGRNTFSNVVQSPADCTGCTRNMGHLVQEGSPGTTTFWFDSSQRAQFSVPAPGELGNTGRNFFVKPSYFQTDLAILKNLKFTERFNLDLRLDAQNLLNNPSFDNPTASITSTIFGRIRDSVISSSRKMQLSLKLHF